MSILESLHQTLLLSRYIFTGFQVLTHKKTPQITLPEGVKERPSKGRKADIHLMGRRDEGIEATSQ